MICRKEFIGEFAGTFILVFFGCGAVAVDVLFGAFSGLFQVALIWGITVTLAIYATGHLSNAHLNPAVSIAMVTGRRMDIRCLPAYLLSQFLGAFSAAAVLYLLFSPQIAAYENSNGIIRGTERSIETAMIFTEFYPNPGFAGIEVSMLTAFAAEAIGTFFLVVLIFSLTEGCNVGRPEDSFAPVFIGLTVTLIICLIAPLTQAGINPVRDFAPRVFTYLAGWKTACFCDNHGGFFWVYIFAPIVGAILGSQLFVRIVEPAMKHDRCTL